MGGNQNLACASGDQLRGGLLLGEVAGALHGHVDIPEWYLGRILLRRYLNRPVASTLAADDDGIAPNNLDLAWEAPCTLS